MARDSDNTLRLTVFTNRHGHKDNYNVKKTDTGWYITYAAHIEGACDKTGHPNLFDILGNDLVSYPRNLGYYMEYLWNQAEEMNMSDAEIQEQLNVLGNWISVTEKATPGGFFASC